MYNADASPLLITPVIAGIVVVFMVGALFGTFSYEKNTRDCTIACPGNVESIEYNGSCYCKLEGK